VPNTIIPGYELPIGPKKIVAFDHYGPASYTQFVAAGANNDVINAADLGVGGFDYMDSDMADATGQFYAFVLPGNGAAANVANNNAVTQMTLIWYSRVTATVGGQAQTAGAQVVAATNLSTFGIRLRAMCV